MMSISYIYVAQLSERCWLSTWRSCSLPRVIDGRKRPLYSCKSAGLAFHTQLNWKPDGHIAAMTMSMHATCSPLAQPIHMASNALTLHKLHRLWKRMTCYQPLEVGILCHAHAARSYLVYQSTAMHIYTSLPGDRTAVQGEAGHTIDQQSAPHTTASGQRPASQPVPHSRTCSHTTASAERSCEGGATTPSGVYDFASGAAPPPAEAPPRHACHRLHREPPAEAHS